MCVSKNIERIVAAIVPKSNHTTVYNGVSIKTEFDGTQDKERIVLCVALVSTLQAFYIKGIDRYNSLAKEMGDTHFTLVGCSPDIFTKAGIKKAKNLRVIPALEHSKLALLFSKAKVYCQLSRRESFSLALAEAMYHNCIPVISNTGGMPEVTGGLGYCINAEVTCNQVFSKSLQFISNETNSESSDSTHCLADAVRKALDEPLNTAFRKHIEQNFSASHREQAISNLLIGRN